MMDIYKFAGEEAMIKKGDDWMPLTEGYCKGFDLDLKFGKMGEEFVEDISERVDIAAEG